MVGCSVVEPDAPVDFLVLPDALNLERLHNLCEETGQFPLGLHRVLASNDMIADEG